LENIGKAFLFAYDICFTKAIDWVGIVFYGGRSSLEWEADAVRIGKPTPPYIPKQDYYTKDKPSNFGGLTLYHQFLLKVWMVYCWAYRLTTLS
jgi:hypothetical protein